MPVCAVKSCKNRSQSSSLTKDGITFHRFPNTPSLKRKWVEAIGNPDWTPTKTSTVCSKHFETVQFDSSSINKRRLCKTAVPTLCLPSSEPTTENSALNERNRILINKLKLQNMEYKKLIRSQQETISQLKNKKGSVKKTVKSIDEILSELSSKCYIDAETASILSDISLDSKELLQIEVLITEQGKVLKTKYTPSLRTFALTFNFYSPKGYEYVRKTFKTCLPSSTVLNKWFQTIKGSPGFHLESFATIKEKAEKSNNKILCALIIDELQTDGNVVFDNADCKYYGFTDAGTGLDSDCLNHATEALVFFIVALNASWKIPVAYFLIDKINYEQKQSLIVRCLEMIEETGVTIVCLTFSGYPANISVAQSLGCCFDPRIFKTTFKHPSKDDEVAIFFDPCHMIKCLKNTFRQFNVITDQSKSDIKWKYLENLESSLKAIKDRNAILYDKMVKLKLANMSRENIFNKTIVETMKYCEGMLELDSFKDSKGTIIFLETVNNLFDILNSRIKQIGLKKPLNYTNKDLVFQILDETEQYLMNLMITATISGHRKKTKLIESNNRMGILGLCVDIESIKYLYRKLVEEENVLTSIPAHKFGQSQVRFLFSYICSHQSNNNLLPAKLMQTVYKKIMNVEGKKFCDYGPDITTLNWPSPIELINASTENYRCQYDGYDDIRPIKVSKLDFTFCDLSSVVTSEYREAILQNTANVVVENLVKSLRCEVCIAALLSKEKIGISLKALIGKGFMYASKDVVIICKTSESILKEAIASKDKTFLLKKSTLLLKILGSLPILNLFQSIETHQFITDPLCNHLIHLTKAVIEDYLSSHLNNLT